jgi:hypothetical protein
MLQARRILQKNAWSYTSTPQYIFMAWCLVKHRDNFTFTFTHTRDYHKRYKFK